MRIVLAALLWLSFAGAASPHALWLEADAAVYHLYFGEFGENLREGSPGLLDRLEPIPAAKAFGASGDLVLKAEKKPTSFQFAGVPEGTGSVVAEQARVTERKQVEKTIRTLDRYSARYIAGFGERKPLIPLDIVPAGAPGRFKVFYDGKPLPGARAEIVTEFGWTKELKSDESGAFEVALPWKGTYVIEVSLADNTPGMHGTVPYDGMRFVTTLSFKVPDGLAAPPRPPAVTPKR